MARIESFLALKGLVAVLSLTSYQQMGIQCADKVASGRVIREGREEFYARPGVPTREILEARGYLADDFHFLTRDGYMLRVTRGRSPLINKGRAGLAGRAPILFVHGILESYNSFVINSFDARPNNFANFTLNHYALDDLKAQLGDVPSAKALPLLAMDFGHEVFILSRRGFPGSQELAGDPLKGAPDNRGGNSTLGPLTALLGGLANASSWLHEIPFSFDSKFWDYSLDQQAKYDFPQAVDFVRNQTGVDKIAVVAHSAGGAIALMALSQHQELNGKLSALVMWSQAFSLGHNDFFNFLPPLLPLLRDYVGSVPPAFLTEPIQSVFGLLCQSRKAQAGPCEGLFDIALGHSGGQEPMRPEFINSILYTSSSHEIAQLLQNVVLRGQMHSYDNNLKLAKPYDLSRVTNTKMSFYAAARDFLVSPADVRATLTQLNVPHNFHLIRGVINHNGYFWHQDTARLAVIPTLREIHLLTGAK